MLYNKPIFFLKVFRMDFSKFYKYIFLVAVILLTAFLQLQNQLYANDVSKYEELTDKVIVENNYRNKIFSYTGEISKTFKNQYGIITVYFANQNFTNTVTASIFPNLGVIDEKILASGNKIKVTGTLKQYNDNYQIAPLDKESIVLISTANFCENSISAKDISKNMEKIVNLSKVSIVNSQEFTTKKGKTNLRLKLKIEDMVFDGIIFENNYTDNVKELLKKQEQNLCAKIKVGQYKGDISINVLGLSKAQ